VDGGSTAAARRRAPAEGGAGRLPAARSGDSEGGRFAFPSEDSDDELCEAIHGTVDTEQEFMDAYAAAHEAKYGTEFVVA
jgi:hypothetical protein